MAWSYIYHDKEDTNSDKIKTPFDEKRRKDNMPRNYPEGISAFCDAVFQTTLWWVTAWITMKSFVIWCANKLSLVISC